MDQVLEVNEFSAIELPSDVLDTILSWKRLSDRVTLKKGLSSLILFLLFKGTFGLIFQCLSSPSWVIKKKSRTPK